MAEPISIKDIDLRPVTGKSYFSIDREWREELIYFLMVDRFQDDAVRPVAAGPGRSAGIATPNSFYGGTIEGVTKNLDYIAGLGCTAIWLSPVFENNVSAYHGYDITNYLRIDPRFGTKQDLIELVELAHGYKKDGRPFPIRIILDVVINHSGDNWFYPGGFRYFYSNDTKFDFGDFRRADRPVRPSFGTRIGTTVAARWGTMTHTPRTSMATCMVSRTTPTTTMRSAPMSSTPS